MAHGLGGGLTGTRPTRPGRIRLWGLLVLLLRESRAGFRTRIISDKNVIGWPADQASERAVSCATVVAPVSPVPQRELRHILHPHSDKNEKGKLAGRTGLKENQVCTRFAESAHHAASGEPPDVAPAPDRNCQAGVPLKKRKRRIIPTRTARSACMLCLHAPSACSAYMQHVHAHLSCPLCGLTHLTRTRCCHVESCQPRSGETGKFV